MPVASPWTLGCDVLWATAVRSRPTPTVQLSLARRRPADSLSILSWSAGIRRLERLDQMVANGRCRVGMMQPRRPVEYAQVAWPIEYGCVRPSTSAAEVLVYIRVPPW